jgi:hypothetical protein
MYSYRPEIRKLSSDSSVESNGPFTNTPVTSPSPSTSTDSMSSLNQKRAYFYIPEDDYKEHASDDDEDDEKPTFNVTKVKKPVGSTTIKSVQQSKQPQNQPVNKEDCRPQCGLRRASKVLDFALLEALAQCPTDVKSSTRKSVST